MDEKIIDINRYLGASQDGQSGRTFSVWGGDGLRARFALPVWRAIHLLDGERGGIVRLPMGGTDPRPIFLLDLVQEPARADCTVQPLTALLRKDAPAMAFDAAGEMALLLGEDEKGSWFLQVWGGSSGIPLEGRSRETLLFLAGECAGLLFFRDLTEGGA